MAIRIGNGSNNNLNGTILADLMLGNGGNDTLTGGAGSDTIFGGSGKDVIIGGLGLDVMTGGDGCDTFVYNSVFESLTFAPDVITDFEQCEDVIDLCGLLGSADLALDYDGDPIANGVWATKIDFFGIKTTVVKVDVTGDSVADMHIVLNGWYDLTKKDFKGVNNAPDADDDTAEACENESICIDVLDNDSDPDCDDICLKDLAATASMTVSGDPGNGTNMGILSALTGADLAALFDIVDGKVHFDPGNVLDALLPGQTATISIEYTIEDESGATDTATLTVEVEGKRDTSDDRWIVTDFVAGFSVGDWAVLDNDNCTTAQSVIGVDESISDFWWDGTNFNFQFDYSLDNDDTSFEYTTNLGETATVNVEEYGTNLLLGDFIDLTNESYEFAHLDGLGGADTLIGGSANDQLVGGAGSDILRGGKGDDTLTGGTDLLPPADTFQLIAPTCNGTDVITDFDVHTTFIVSITYDRIAFQQGADGWNASGSNPNPGNTSGLDSGAYKNRDNIAAMRDSENNKVVELQNEVANTADIKNAKAIGDGNSAINAYVVLFNEQTDHGEIWWDANWRDTGGRYHVATIENLDSLNDVKYLNSADFAEWSPIV